MNDGKKADQKQMDLDKNEHLDEEMDNDENIDDNKVEIEYKEGEVEEENEEEDPETEEEKKIRTEEEEKLIKREFDFRTDGEIYCIDVYEKKGIAFIGDGEETLYVYDLDNKKLLLKEKLHTDSIAFARISNDEKYLATAGLEGAVKIWDLEDLINNNKFTLLNNYESSTSEINVLED
jgi:WD40 repeat protein